MKPPHHSAGESFYEGGHSQLWIRQRRLRVKASSTTADGVSCTCGRTSEVDGSSRPRTIESAELLGGEREVQIVHAGETYRLLVTRNNKLILQK